MAKVFVKYIWAIIIFLICFFFKIIVFFFIMVKFFCLFFAFMFAKGKTATERQKVLFRYIAVVLVAAAALLFWLKNNSSVSMPLKKNSAPSFSMGEMEQCLWNEMIKSEGLKKMFDNSGIQGIKDITTYDGRSLFTQNELDGLMKILSSQLNQLNQFFLQMNSEDFDEFNNWHFNDDKFFVDKENHTSIKNFFSIEVEFNNGRFFYFMGDQIFRSQFKNCQKIDLAIKCWALSLFAEYFDENCATMKSMKNFNPQKWINIERIKLLDMFGGESQVFQALDKIETNQALRFDLRAQEFKIVEKKYPHNSLTTLEIKGTRCGVQKEITVFL